MPSSRLTIAAWEVRPPRFVTMAAAVFITGSQSGVVVSETRTSPGLNSGRRLTSVTIRAFPTAILSPMLFPAASTVPRSSRWNVSRRSPAFCDCTVSGRAWTTKSSPVSPSFAHSISIGTGLPAFAE